MTRFSPVRVGLLLLAAVLLVGSAAASGIDPLKDVEVVCDFPSPLYGGSAGSAEYRLTFTAETSLLVQVAVGHPLLDEATEWSAAVVVGGDVLACEEIAPGVFRSATRVVPKGVTPVVVTLQPLPNVYPDLYEYTVDLYYLPGTQPVTPEEGKHIPLRRIMHYTPPVVSTPTPGPVVTPTPTPTPLPGDLADQYPWWVWLLPAILLLLVFAVWAYWKSRQAPPQDPLQPLH